MSEFTRWSHRRLAPAIVALLALAGGACSTKSSDAATDQSAALSSDSATVDSGGARGDGARRVTVIGNFRTPESVRYDAQQDVYFVSNINGGPSATDSNGFIVRIDAANPKSVTMFAESGKNGVVLHGPKGLAITGDTLWVADLDAVRGFDRHTGRPVVTVDFRAQKPLFLNDLAVGPDGAIYVTDTGIIINDKGTLHPGPDRIFRIGEGHRITTIVNDSALAPNGLTWDTANKRWLLVTFAPLTSQLLWFHQGDTTLTPIAGGRGKFDAVELISGGRILVTCWGDSSVHLFAANGKDHQLIHGIPEPADLGVDTKRNRVLVPSFTGDKVEIWELAADVAAAPKPR